MKTKSMLMVGVLAGAVAMFTGCKSTGVQRAAKAQDAIVDARARMAKAKETVAAAITSLSTLRLENSNLEEIYPILRRQAKELSAALERYNKDVAEIEKTAKAKYDAWQQELAGIKNPDIKKESSQRLHTALQHHAEIMKLLKASKSTLEPFVADLNDIVKYLELDLSRTGVKKISSSINRAIKEGGEVEKWIDEVRDLLAKRIHEPDN